MAFYLVFKKALLQRGITEDDLKKSIEVDSQAQTILKQQVKGMLRINDSLVENYYKTWKNDFYTLEATIFRSLWEDKVIKIFEKKPIAILLYKKEKFYFLSFG